MVARLGSHSMIHTCTILFTRGFMQNIEGCHSKYRSFSRIRELQPRLSVRTGDDNQSASIVSIVGSARSEAILSGLSTCLNYYPSQTSQIHREHRQCRRTRRENHTSRQASRSTATAKEVVSIVSIVGSARSEGIIRRLTAHSNHVPSQTSQTGRDYRP